MILEAITPITADNPIHTSMLFGVTETPNILMPREVDQIFRYPRGRAKRLALAGALPCIILPDGDVRFREDVIQKILLGESADSQAKELAHA